MGENKNKVLKALGGDSERQELIEEVLKLRGELNLPTEEHHKKFFQKASLPEIREILVGLQDLAVIFGKLERVQVGLD